MSRWREARVRRSPLVEETRGETGRVRHENLVVERRQLDFTLEQLTRARLHEDDKSLSVAASEVDSEVPADHSTKVGPTTQSSSST